MISQRHLTTSSEPNSPLTTPSSTPSSTPTLSRIGGSFTSGSEDPEVHYRIVLHDPRLVRLRIKYSPKWDKESCKQRLRNLVDPSNIPVIGIVTNLSRAKAAHGHRKDLLKVQKGRGEDDQLKKTFGMMENGFQRRKVWYTTGAITKTMFLFVPTPAPGAGTAVATGLGALAGELGSKIATTIANPLVAEGTEAVVKKEQENSAIAEANYKYQATRAFLIYLGAPPSSDDIYHSWEDSRLTIKLTYGATAEDDLSKQKPNNATMKKIKEAFKSSEKGFDLDELKISLLCLLWLLYDCWDEQYYDVLVPKKFKMKKSELHRVQDERLILMMINPINPKVQLLTALSMNDVVNLFASPSSTGYGTHPRFMPLIERGSELFERKAFNKMIKWLAKTFIKKKCLWGYFEDSGLLSAVICYEKPEAKRILLSQTFSKHKLLSSRIRSSIKSQHRLLVEEDEYVGNNMPEGPGVLHFFAALESDQGPRNLVELIKSATEYTSKPSYACEYSSQRRRLEILKECNFTISNSTNNLCSFVYKPPPRIRSDYSVTSDHFEHLAQAAVDY